MIKATFYRDSNGLYNSFTVTGHAGYAESGMDIVCSAVSVLTINCVNSIEQFTKANIDVKQDKSGTIKFKFKTDLDSKDSNGQLLINSFVLGITEIAKEYGDKHLQVYFKEV